MSGEQRSDLGAYNLRSKKKLVDSPAVIVVGKSEPTLAENKPVGEEEGRLLPTTSDQ